MKANQVDIGKLRQKRGMGLINNLGSGSNLCAVPQPQGGMQHRTFRRAIGAISAGAKAEDVHPISFNHSGINPVQ